MFTGIVEEMAVVEDIEQEMGNTHFTFSCSFTSELQIDQSVAHDGVCLTVVAIDGNVYKVTAIAETLSKTNLGALHKGDLVNLERCVKVNQRLDGHMVQGHVDLTGTVDSISDENGSFKIHISYDAAEHITVKKGSVCINGVSLTVVDAEDGLFSVALIPYTWEHTNLGRLKTGDKVNIEFDILGKYIQKLIKNYF